jgi:gluconokinase
MVIILMGVSGSGKTTIGRLLTDELGWNCADADDFHPPANITKMSAGQPLNDADRVPWLAALRAYIERALAADENALVACSALKESYRATLVVDPARVRVVFLHASRQLLLERLEQRSSHFMKAGMLDSQLATLEPPADALSLDVSAPPEELVAEIRRAFRV